MKWDNRNNVCWSPPLYDVFGHRVLVAPLLYSSLSTSSAAALVALNNMRQTEPINIPDPFLPSREPYIPLTPPSKVSLMLARDVE